MTGIKRTFLKNTLAAKKQANLNPVNPSVDGLIGMGAGRISLPAERDLKKQG